MRNHPVQLVAALAMTMAGSGAALADGIEAPMPLLPLDRGYYVRTDDTCATASGATTAMLQRRGLYWGSSFCLFQSIEQTGEDTFRIVHYCTDVRAPPPPEPIPEDWLATADWIITSPTSFSFTDNNGWEHEARLCAQADMPDGYQDDISELIE